MTYFLVENIEEPHSHFLNTNVFVVKKKIKKIIAVR